MQASFLLSCCSHVCMCCCLCIQVVYFLFSFNKLLLPSKSMAKPQDIKKFHWKVGHKTNTNSILFLTELFCKHTHSCSWPQRLYICMLPGRAALLFWMSLSLRAYLSFRSLVHKLKKKKRFREISVTVHKILWFYFLFLFSLTIGRSYRHASESLHLNTV